MTGDLISRSALLAEYEWLKSQVSACSVCEVMEHMERIRNAPAVEAEPVVHARWEFKCVQQIAPNCSNCGMLSIQWYPNCPYCRAKMKNGRKPNGT